MHVTPRPREKFTYWHCPLDRDVPSALRMQRRMSKLNEISGASKTLHEKSELPGNALSVGAAAVLWNDADAAYPPKRKNP